MTLEKQCALSSHCKRAGQERFCNITCFPYVVLHGISGNGGIWGALNVPSKYKNCFMSNLPIKEENPITYEIIRRYCGNILDNVGRGIGLFMCSKPTEENKLGTGTGKTTSAITILNEYVLKRVIQHVTGERPIEENPGLFMRASEFQNMYNAQFRGTPEMKEVASERFYKRKEQLKKVELLVFDDIAMRDCTDAFLNELAEIIDERDTYQRTTIYTSNLPLEKVSEVLGERITSRIFGMTEKLVFTGRDHRRGGIL